VVLAVVKIAGGKNGFLRLLQFFNLNITTHSKMIMQTWLPCGSDNTVELSILETTGCLELAVHIKITLHTFRTTRIHLLVRTKTAVTPQLVSSQLPGCVRFIPLYVKLATRFKSKGRQKQGV